MSIPNLIPHKTLYISGYIYSYYAFVFIFEFPEHISKHILQFHAFFYEYITAIIGVKWLLLFIGYDEKGDILFLGYCNADYHILQLQDKH